MRGGLLRRLRLARMGLATVLGLGRQGFFIPYRYAGGVRPDAGYEWTEGLFRQAEPAFRAVLEEIGRYEAALEAIGDAPPPAPRWRQGWFCRLDGAAAYALVRSRRPRRIVEIGSGHSTRFMARAIADGGLETELTAIDPAPRADIAGIARHIPALVADADPAPIRALEAGDILFIDSSHIAQPGTDVDHLFGRILPALPAGVLVHVHDILLPDPYPDAWRWRGYNEQLIAVALMAGGAFRPLFASHYVATRMEAALAASPVARLPLIEGGLETSLWMEKQAAPPGAHSHPG